MYTRFRVLLIEARKCYVGILPGSQLKRLPQCERMNFRAYRAAKYKGKEQITDQHILMLAWTISVAQPDTNRFPLIAPIELSEPRA
jgi:hypothetical protein